jgi:hypothetical protein
MQLSFPKALKSFNKQPLMQSDPPKRQPISPPRNQVFSTESENPALKRKHSPNETQKPQISPQLKKSKRILNLKKSETEPKPTETPKV